VTLLFTDIEGSTRLWQAGEAAMRAALSRHDSLLRKTVSEQDGVVFSSMGDGIAAAFSSASAAVSAALASQRLLDEESWPTAWPIRVRMGIHTGEAVSRDGDYLGTAVNRAARLMDIGHGGQVLCSSATAEILGNDAGELVDLGEHRLRDLDRPMHVFQLGAGRFPPLRSLDSFLGNLPLQISSFVGRERELARGNEALRSSRVVTLTGVGGVGKTRLALQLAAQVLPRFGDGAWLVELDAVRDPDRVADAVAGVFRVTPRGSERAGDAVIEFLRAKQMLLVLDNCEHLLDAVADLVYRIERSCAKVVVLATSREGLALEGEQLLAVPSLAVPEIDNDLELVARCDAVVLFVERAQRVDADFVLCAENCAMVAQVCQRLDGVPLAIELAAARVNTMTPSELASSLDRRFETLAGGRRGPVQRHQTLRSAMDWSYDLLSEAEQRLLARLSVFSGGCTRESAEKVCGGQPISTSRVFASLTGLVARSLVVADRHGSDTRYRLLETIREYGEERLAQHGESKTVRRGHAEHYCAYTRRLCELFAGPQQPEATRLFRAEHENLVAAMAYAVDDRHTDVALRLLTAPEGLAHQLHTYQLPINALELEGAADHPLFPRALATAAVYVHLAGDSRRGEEFCEAALAASGSADRDPVVEYLVPDIRAHVAQYRDDWAAAADLWLRSVEVARSAGLLYEQIWSLATYSIAVVAMDDRERALALAAESLALARQLDAPLLVGYCLMSLSSALAGSDPPEARRLFREGAAATTAVRGLGPMELSVIAFQAAAMEDWETVLEVAPDAIRGFHWLGERPNQAGTLNIVSRALATLDAETAALLQGATRKLMSRPSALPVDPEMTREPVPSPAATGRGGIIVELRRQTTSILRETLGEARLRELRSEGEAMDDNDVVRHTLEAIVRAQSTAQR
jgi:predicted ATPase